MKQDEQTSNDAEVQESLDAMRGLMYGVVLGLLSWVLIGVIIWWSIQ